MSEPKFEVAVQRALELELLPRLREVGEDAEARLRVRSQAELPELAARIAAAASRGDQAMLEALSEVPELWFEQERVRLSGEQAEVLRATVRAVFGILFQLMAA